MPERILGVLAHEGNPFAEGMLQAAARTPLRPVFLSGWSVAAVACGPTATLRQPVAIWRDGEDGAKERLELASGSVVVNLGVPHSTHPHLDATDRAYAAAENRASWLALLRFATSVVVNRPSDSMWWLTESHSAILRRRLRKDGIATATERVVSAANLDASPGAALRVPLPDQRPAAVAQLDRAAGSHYLVLPYEVPVRQRVELVIFDHSIALEFANERSPLKLSRNVSPSRATARISIEACRLLALDVAFVSFIFSKRESRLSLVSLWPPAPISPDAAEHLVEAFLAELMARVPIAA